MRFNHRQTTAITLKATALRSLLILACIGWLSACSSTPKSTASHQPVNDKSNPGAGAPYNEALGALDEPATTSAVKPLGIDSNSLWSRIRDGYQLDHTIESPLIDNEVTWYRNNPTFVYRATERSSRYLHYVVAAAQQRNMPTEIALLPFIESAYDPFAYSRSGAAGLWQFVPQTATTFGLKHNWWFDSRKDVVASTDAALDYLQTLHEKFNKDWFLAIAAYNFGEGSIQRAVDYNRSKGLPIDFWHLNLREETRKYVPRLLAFTKIIAEPQRYGISLYSIPDQPYFASANTKGQLALSRASALANVDIDELLRLNPGLNHATVSNDSPQRILLPIYSVDRFAHALDALPSSERIQWQQYKVIKGDTLASISRKFNIAPNLLVSANNLNNQVLKPGKELLIPQSNAANDTNTIAQPTPTAVATATPFGSTQIFHTVEANDNLRRVAQRYGVNIKDIQRWNGLGPDDPIKLGQKLNIWTDEVGSKPAKTNTVAATKKVGYTVQNGDSLTAIATKFNLEIDDILRWNQINPRSLLQPGQHLTLFIGH